LTERYGYFVFGLDWPAGCLHLFNFFGGLGPQRILGNWHRARVLRGQGDSEWSFNEWLIPFRYLAENLLFCKIFVGGYLPRICQWPVVNGLTFGPRTLGLALADGLRSDDLFSSAGQFLHSL
jgi:hypothetical protein